MADGVRIGEKVVGKVVDNKTVPVKVEVTKPAPKSMVKGQIVPSKTA